MEKEDKNLAVEIKDDFKETIQESISKITIYRKSVVAIKIQSRLKKELSLALKKSNSKTQKYFIYDITQKQILSYIYNVDNNLNKIEFDLFPLNITKNQVMFYLGLKFNNPLSVNLKDETMKLYKKLNNLDLDYNNSLFEFEDDSLKCFSFDSVPKDDGIKTCVLDFTPIEKKTDKSIKEVKVAVASININHDEVLITDMKGVFPKTYNINSIMKIIVNAKKAGAEIILFPEFCIPFDYAFEIIKLSWKYKISIITGLTHYIEGDKAKNYTLIRDDVLNIVLLKSKNYFAEEEKKLCVDNNLNYLESEKPYYFILNNGKYKYSTMTCFESTNIKDRALLSDKIEILFMPVFNMDTFYFSNLIASYTRDASCFIAQSNTSCFGDSRITGPYSQVIMDLIKLKGGENNYFAMGTIKLEDLALKHSRELELSVDLDLGVKLSDKEYQDYKNLKAKPLSAGNHYDRHKNGIR